MCALIHAFTHEPTNPYVRDRCHITLWTDNKLIGIKDDIMQGVVLGDRKRDEIGSIKDH